MLSVSIQDLRPNSQDTTAFYVANIYQLLLADGNKSAIIIPPGLSDPSHFSPSTTAVLINSLWFLSLVISLTCALLATLLQQWARRYLRVTQPRYSPHKRSPIRAFFAEGVDKLHLPWAVETLPTLLHASLFLFFLGLVIFLFSINHTVFTVVLWWVGLCTGAYICITFMPIFRQDSPYYTPLSLSIWFLVTGLLYLVCQFLSWLEVFHLYDDDTWRRLANLKIRYLRWFRGGLVKAAEETAQELSSGLDCRALLSTFESLDEDHELERFFAAIPGLCNSKALVYPPLTNFIKPNDRKLSAALINFMDRTLSSEIVPESVKQRRIVICRMAVDATSLSASRLILDRILLGTWDRQLYSVEFGHSARRWGNGGNLGTAFRAKCVVALVMALVQKRDERWFGLAIDQLGVSRSALQSYLAHGDSVLLANLIYITRQIVLYHSENGDWPCFYGVSLRILEATSRFNVQRALSELQHEFCSLWNQLVLTARNSEDSHISMTTLRMLKRIRKVYIALHKGTDAMTTALFTLVNDDDPKLNLVPSYPLCNIESHHTASLDPAHRLPEVAAHTTDDIPDTPTTSPVTTFPSLIHWPSTPTTVPHSSPPQAPSLHNSPNLSHDAFLTTIPHPTAYEAPSPSYPAPSADSTHHISPRPDSPPILSSRAHIGFAPPSPPPTSFCSPPQITSVPAHAITVRTTELPTRVGMASGSSQSAQLVSHSSTTPPLIAGSWCHRDADPLRHGTHLPGHD
jgi:Family of unknown function (DUF6535)